MFFTNPESTNFMFHFSEGCKVFISVMINSYVGILYLNRKLLPCRKKKKNREKIRRFRNREKMWWAWPLARCVHRINFTNIFNVDILFSICVFMGNLCRNFSRITAFVISRAYDTFDLLSNKTMVFIEVKYISYGNMGCQVSNGRIQN